MWYHVFLTLKGGLGPIAIVGLEEHALEARVLSRYRSGEALSHQGRIVRWGELEKIEIFQTEFNLSQLSSRALELTRRSLENGFPREVTAADLARDGENVTKTYILDAPGIDSSVPLILQPARALNWYHVYVSADGTSRDGTWQRDFDEHNLRTRIVAPYDAGTAIVLDGRNISASRIKQIKIWGSALKFEATRSTLPRARVENRYTRVITYPDPSDETVYNQMVDVTDEFIGGAPGWRSLVATPKTGKALDQGKAKIFIVHGHDNEMKEAVARLITNAGLTPVILHEQPDQGRTIIEKLEVHAEVDYAVALFSPDDKCIVERKTVWRARQNVIFELGFFLGRLGRSRVTVLHRGKVDVLSDFQGVLRKPYDPGGAWRQELLKELESAGLLPAKSLR